MNGNAARQKRRMAAMIRKRHQQDVEKLIAAWPWYKRAVSWLLPKVGERWASRTIDEANRVDDYAERRTYKWLKNH